jgi:outer membrane lipoprotein-sorting protein
MKRLASLVLLAAALFSAAPGRAAAPAPLDPQGNVLFRRMVALNAALRTYKADVHLDVALKTFPFISPSLDGNVYYQKPDKQAIVFDTVPALAAQFKKVYPKVDPPVRWLARNDVAVLDDSGGQTTFRLVPKVNGRVEHLDVKVDDSNATIVSYTWTYKDGGFITFAQSFTSVGGNLLVAKQTGHVELPAYKADVVSNFSNYKLNVSLDDSVFVEK